MPDIPSWIYPCFPIGISDPCDILSRNVLWWVCMTSSILDLLGTLVPSHLWIELDVPLNLLLRTLRYVRVHIVVEVPVSVKPIRIVSGGVSAPPALQRGIDPTCCLSYELFGTTNVHGRGLPFGILWTSLYNKWSTFLIQPVRSISGFIIFSSWRDEPQWSLFPLFLISRFCRRQWILIKCSHNHIVVILYLKYMAQACHLYWGVYLKHDR